MTLAEEFRSRNFSIYGQWAGVLSMIVCFATGIANFFNLIRPILILFGILAFVTGFIIIFIEVPLLLRICPTSAKFDAGIRRFSTNYMRAAFYGVASLAQWLSLLGGAGSLIAAAVFLLFAAVFYALAGFKGQDFTSSKTLGGAGVAQMIV